MSILLRLLLGIPFILLCTLFAPVVIFLLLVGSPLAFVAAHFWRKHHHDDSQTEKGFSFRTTPQPH